MIHDLLWAYKASEAFQDRISSGSPVDMRAQSRAFRLAIITSTGFS